MGVLDTLRVVLGLILHPGDPALGALITGEGALVTALGVATIGWASISLGHGGVLLINRVRGVRMIVAGLLGLVSVVVLRVVEALVTWVVATLATGRVIPAEEMVVLFLLAMAPHAFAAFTFLPHLGLFLGRALEAWSFIVIFLLLAGLYDIGVGYALAVTASGWLAMHLLSRALAAPIGWVASRLWSIASGQPVIVTSRDILAGTPFIPVNAVLGEDAR
ncbi:MAG: hypothetical protein QM708_08145 [Propioniciclava sp.]|uniref:hypothetical protein n=1 Tax=Propioniciclava sp. TaxID=2038686 RepID=UPI0039E5620E